MRSPLSSRTNSRPERVTPDEFFDLVASSTVMVFPLCRSCLVSTCPRWPLFDAREPPTRVKHREPRRITGNEKAAHVGRIRQDRWTAGISQPLGYDFCWVERTPRMACFVPLNPKSRTPEFVRWCRIH